METTIDQKTIKNIIKEHRLPESFGETLTQWYLPLATSIAGKHTGQPLLLGVQGSQGSGKSTLAECLGILLEQCYQLRSVSISLDDFYLTYAERQTLAESVHPLFATRGVPGTHDVELAKQTLQQLITQRDGDTVNIPRFNKAIDDRHPTAKWDHVDEPVDIIIFEGWCVGIDAQIPFELSQAINELERIEDPEAIWRTYANTKLSNEYQELFGMLDYLVVLQAPSFECVYEWRWLQEQKLSARWQQDNTDAPTRLLDENSVKRFVSHYERLTRHGFKCLPAKADWLLTLNKEHKVTAEQTT